MFLTWQKIIWIVWEKNTTTLKKNIPGKKWYKKFLSRHFDTIRSRMCQNIKTSSAKVSPSDIDSYINNLKEVIANVPASNIINYDETNSTVNSDRSKCVYSNVEQNILKE